MEHDFTDLMISEPRTNEDITPDEYPDPDVSNLRMAGSWILVRPVNTIPEKTKGGIYLTGQQVSDIKYLHNTGRVLKCGPRCYKTKDDKTVNYVEGGLKVGDHIQWERLTGKRFIYKGISLALIRDVDVQFALDDPYDLDSTVHLGE